MINLEYLLKFGDLRYDNFLYGQAVNDERFFSDKEESFCINELYEKIQCNNMKTKDLILYWVFTMIEEIHRIDFDSKYVFHTLTPKARNMDSIRMGIVIGENIYTFNGLSNEIYVNKNNVILAEKSKAYIIVFSDDRKTQFFYGDFHKMLSLLNLGHAVFNIEYALSKTSLNYKNAEKVVLNEKLYNCLLKNYIYINKVFEVNLDTISETTIEEPLFFKRGNVYNKEPIINNTNYLKSFFDNFTKNDFVLRSSAQKTIGDVTYSKFMPQHAFDYLLNNLSKISKETQIQLYFYINNIQGYEKGYYFLKDEELTQARTTNNFLEHDNILREYQDFTNLNNLNLWVFMNISDYKKEKDYDSLFVDMGIIAQFISVYIGKFKLAARAIKNYNDVYIKSQFELENNDLVGYSLAIFPIKSNTQSYILKSGE
ncbi:hypothetical protein [Hathewaya massiliensis]|uniref:hypothetical protein n=1 Tax=Hathewaya massiliensis TaxID=1964382 RepID=UPI001159DF73|nr:hypothetical protein [Hathewaya massiliensis]